MAVGGGGKCTHPTGSTIVKSRRRWLSSDQKNTNVAVVFANFERFFLHGWRVLSKGSRVWPKIYSTVNCRNCSRVPSPLSSPPSQMSDQKPNKSGFFLVFVIFSHAWFCHSTFQLYILAMTLSSTAVGHAYFLNVWRIAERQPSGRDPLRGNESQWIGCNWCICSWEQSHSRHLHRSPSTTVSRHSILVQDFPVSSRVFCIQYRSLGVLSVKHIVPRPHPDKDSSLNMQSYFFKSTSPDQGQRRDSFQWRWMPGRCHLQKQHHQIFDLWGVQSKIQRVRKVFRPLYIFHSLFHCSHLLKSKKFILFLINVHSAPHLDRKNRNVNNFIKKEKLKYHMVISIQTLCCDTHVELTCWVSSA